MIKLSDGSESLLKADTVILSIGMKPVDVLLPELNNIVAEVHAIGDCVTPRKVKDAVWEAYKRAASI
jgi:hypothetical protein